MFEYFAGVIDRALDPLTWVKVAAVSGLYLLTLYPVLGERPWAAPGWMGRLATRVFVRGRVDSTDGWLLCFVTTLMGLMAATAFGWNLETVLAADATMIGVMALRVYNHLGLTNRRLAEAEAELNALKEPRREDEATPA